MTASRSIILRAASYDNPFWGSVRKGVEAAAQDLGVKAIFEAPKEFNPQEELNMLTSAIAAKPDGIAVTYPDPAAFAAPIAEAIDKGIPTILFNIQNFAPRSEDPTGGKIYSLAYVGQDETTSGAKLATAVLPYLKKGDHVLFVNVAPGVIVLKYRFEGEQRVFEANGISIKELAASEDLTKNEALIGAYLTKHPEINAIVGSGTPAIDAAAKYVTDHNLKDKIVLGVYDMDDAALHYMEQGVIKAALLQQPFLQGYGAVANLYWRVKYGMSPVNINTGTFIATPDNVKSVAELVKKGYE